MAIGTLHVLAPPVVDNAENVRVRIWHNPGAIADMVAYAINPNGIQYSLTGHLRLITAGSFTFVEMYIDFNALGDHTIYVRDTVTADWGIAQVRSVAWATNMDMPVSDLNKLRTEVSRVRTLVKKG